MGATPNTTDNDGPYLRTRFQIGAVSLQRVVEAEMPILRPEEVYPDCTPEMLAANLHWLEPRFYDRTKNQLILGFQGFLIRSEGKNILVDTCVGDCKRRARVEFDNKRWNWLDRLREAGVTPEEIHIVVCTHFYVDHVGWNTQLQDGRWVPTFPNARYLFGRIEYEHWKNQKADELSIPVFEDSVRPVFEAGRADFVETDHRLCKEVQLIPSLGHTPGHVSIVIHSKGERALITGDIAHHPCQLERPDWRATVDHDGDKAEATRRRMFADLCGKQVLVFGTHFAGPSAGWIEANGETWKLRPKPGEGSG